MPSQSQSKNRRRERVLEKALNPLSDLQLAEEYADSLADLRLQSIRLEHKRIKNRDKETDPAVVTINTPNGPIDMPIASPEGEYEEGGKKWKSYKQRQTEIAEGEAEFWRLADEANIAARIEVILIERTARGSANGASES